MAACCDAEGEAQRCRHGHRRPVGDRGDGRAHGFAPASAGSTVQRRPAGVGTAQGVAGERTRRGRARICSAGNRVAGEDMPADERPQDEKSDPARHAASHPASHIGETGPARTGSTAAHLPDDAGDREGQPDHGDEHLRPPAVSGASPGPGGGLRYTAIRRTRRVATNAIGVRGPPRCSASGRRPNAPRGPRRYLRGSGSRPEGPTREPRRAGAGVLVPGPPPVPPAWRPQPGSRADGTGDRRGPRSPR